MTDIELVLSTAFRNSINEANVEAGFERFHALAGGVIDYDGFRNAIDACLRDSLIREPIRLPEGALLCHFHLEPTVASPRHGRRGIGPVEVAGGN